MSLKYKIVIGDSRRMAEVEDASVNYIVTSPPYWDLVVFSDGVETGSNRDLSRAQTKEEFFNEIAKTWAECYRVLKPGGYLTCEWEDKPVGSWTHGYPNEVCLVGPMVESIEKSGLILISRVFWKKFETGAAMTKFQYSLYSNLVRSDPRAISNVAYVFTFKKRGDVLTKRPNQLDFNKEDWKVWVDGFWKIENPASTGEGLMAGAVFPYELVRRLIKIYSTPLDVVLDPFLGTGTTMKVAFDLDRSCIGYEALPRLLPFIKSKVRLGTQKIYYRCEWNVVESEDHRQTGVHRNERGG